LAKILGKEERFKNMSRRHIYQEIERLKESKPFEKERNLKISFLKINANDKK